MSGAAPDAVVLALLDSGRRYGRYEVLRQIGHGGMGAVYLARVKLAEGFEKCFAVKVAHPGFASDPAFERRFAAEARLAARIDHPNVCAVVDFGSAHGGHYLVMEHLRGHSLQALLRSVGETLPYDIACRVVCDAARGIHAAHELRNEDGTLVGVVHRDLKPANLFVRDDGVTKVLDFGIARWDDPRAVERTGLGVLRGSSGYMAPEQASQGPLDRRVDVYALGVVLWEATIGRRLYRGASAEETVRMMREAIVPRPTSLRADYPPALERVVLRCLSRRADARYATAAELADALESVLLGMGTVAGLGRVSSWLARAAEGAPSDDDLAPSSGPASRASEVVTTVASAADEAVADAREDAPASSQRDALVAPTREPALRLAGAAIALAALALIVAVWAVATRPTTAASRAAPPTAATAREPRLTSAPAVATETRDDASAPVIATETRDDASAPSETRVREVTATSPERPRVARRLTAPEAFGDVNVMAWPSSAEVSEGGRVLGHTPLAHLRLSAGRHALTLRPVGGGAARTVSVDVAADAPTIVRERW